MRTKIAVSAATVLVAGAALANESPVSAAPVGKAAW